MALEFNASEDVILYEKLFRENFNRLCNTVYRYTQDKEIAKDIVQEVFFKLWTKRRTTTIVGSTEAYLYRAVVNHTLNYLKAEKRKIVPANEIYRQTESAVNTVERTIYSKELEEKIQEAISTLPTGSKQVFLLSRYEDMSYKEIATFLNISVNTVEKQLGRALRILRKSLLSILIWF